MAATAAPLEALFRRDRLVILAAIGLVAAIAWIDLAWMAADMSEDATAMIPEWTPGYFAAMFLMWAVMMAGMMMPSAAPAILLFARLSHHAGERSVVPALAFASGYLATWTLFSLVATLAQWALSDASLLSATMTGQRGWFAGALLVAAGAYQFTALKAACLAKCRSPAEFLVQHRREGRLGAFVMGMDHGLYCVGCCWALMALLFAFGVMNLLWIAALAAFVLVEKLLPAGRSMALVAGVALLVFGAVLFNT